MPMESSLKKTITREVLERTPKGFIVKWRYLADGAPIPDDQKYCPVCDTIKMRTEYTQKGNACRLCANERARKQHKRKKEDALWTAIQLAKNREKRFKRKEEAVAYLGGKCLDCSGVFPTVAFDFHHEDPSEKEGHPSWFLNKSGERWKEELAKCVLLCANCHRIRHFGGGYPYDRTH